MTTIHSIAKKAGVSIGTASRVLNGGTKGVRSDARERAERIMRIAAELDYHPNQAARAIATNRTGYIGYIVSDEIQGGLMNQYFGQVLCGAEAACSGNGYLLNVAVHNLKDIDSFIWPQAVAGKSVDGLILASEVISPEIIAKFEELKVPCVCLSDPVLASKYIVGWSDASESAYVTAIKYAAKCGYRKIGITLKPNSQYLLESINKIMRNNTIAKSCELIHIPVEHPDFASADMVFNNLKAVSPNIRPEIILTSEQCALGLIRAMNRSELSCPDDLGIISCSDSFLLDMVIPAITSVNIDLAGIGKCVTNNLITHIKEKTPLEPVIFDGNSIIVERESVKRCYQK